MHQRTLALPTEEEHNQQTASGGEVTVTVHVNGGKFIKLED